MAEPLSPCDALALLGRLYREGRTGVLSLGAEGQRLRVALLDGQIVGLCPPSGAAEEPAPARPDDSARLKLERVLAEIGMGRGPLPKARAALPPDPGNLKERLLVALSEGRSDAAFEEVDELPDDVVPTAGGTEPLILEAVRRVQGAEAVRSALGDLDQRLVAHTSLAEERTLTLTEGYLLSRIDGLSTTRQVLQLVPLDPEETERSLLGLLLTGRVELQPAPVHATTHHEAAPSPPPAEASPPAEPAPTPETPPVEGGHPPPSAAEMDPEILETRREILDTFQSLPLKDHFEILGVEPGCSDTEVKRAYVALARRFHPDKHRDPRLEDLHDVLEAIFIRVGEAWEVLGDAKSRASYESRFGSLPVRRSKAASPAEGKPVPDTTPAAEKKGAPDARAERGRPRAPSPPARTAPSRGEPDEEPYFPADDTLYQAQRLMNQAQYWDAIQILEAVLPRLQPKRQQQRGRILLARAYAKNPNWLRRAEETLQDVVREDPNNIEAHYQLGLLYKDSGLAARAQAQFRRTLELRPDHREAAAELALTEARPGAGILKRIFRKGRSS
jgi:tetratricopeptide (TPR) repeat protein